MKTEPPQRTPRTRLSRTLLSGILFGLAGLAWAAPVTTTSLSTEIPGYLLPTFLLVLLVILLNGLFVASDISLNLLRGNHVKTLMNGQAIKIQALMEQKDRYIATCTLGSQTMRAWMILLCFIPAPYLAHQYSLVTGTPDSWWTIFTIGVLLTLPVAGLNVIFGELVSRTYAIRYPVVVATKLCGLIRFSAILMGFPGRILTTIASLFTKKFGAAASFVNPNQAEDEIKNIVETAGESGEIDEIEKELLHSVFEFTDTVAREVMTPRIDLDSAPISITHEALLDLIVETGHSRIPIYEETDDQIIGIIHAKDLLSAMRHKGAVNLRPLLRPALSVPENKGLQDLLREMKLHRTQIAIVRDELGGTAGVVTIEDIVEELVGDIIDEYDEEESEIQHVESGWIIEGRTNIYDLNDEIGSAFFSEEFDTVGGYVFGLMGRQPDVGEYIVHMGYKFSIVETDSRRIVKIHIEKQESMQDQLEGLLN